MTTNRFNPERVAKGHPWPGDSRKVVILLDEETFADVRNGALTNQCSFAAQSRMLIEVGLETLRLDDLAPAGEAHRATTTEIGVVHEHATREAGDAQ